MTLFIFPYLSALSQIVVVLVIVRNRKYLDVEMRILATYFVLGLVVDTVQVALALRGERNLWTSQFFFPFQYAMLMIVFFLWNRHSNVAKIMFYSIPAIIAAWSLGSFWWGSLQNTLTYVDPAGAVLLVFAASYTLLRSDRLEDLPVMELPPFWVASATIIYFGATIVWSSLNTTLLRVADPEIKRLAWSTQSVVTIIANFMFAGAFLCLRRKT